MGSINSLFVLGRSIGFIGELSLILIGNSMDILLFFFFFLNCSFFLSLGHYMDQKRLKQGLYRHPWDDISYVLPEQYN